MAAPSPELTLIRFAIVRFKGALEEGKQYTLPTGGADVELVYGWKGETESVVLLAALVPLRYLPKLTREAQVVLPGTSEKPPRTPSFRRPT